ncbi:arf-GAP domain and FG repeat-containing protein 1a isoform X2 [Sardina pilchardus]|uniref:arf-GAP domain and FG repeat-containing protein 1a isoform X2 n=1 Tax=Sardina pilchardus TaxID=27697 RepID=UPI002E14FE61
MAASAKRKQEEKHLKMLREMTSLPPNRKCFDCDQRGPTYANMTVGSFVCTSCSGILRGLNPPHRVKSISMTTFAQQEIEFLQKHGNEVCKQIWLGLYDDRTSSVPDFREPQKVKEFLQEKYEKKRWYVPPEQARVVASVHASISGSSASSTSSTPEVRPLKTLLGESAPTLHLNKNTPSQSPVVVRSQQMQMSHQEKKFDLLSDLGGDIFAAPPSQASSSSSANFANFAHFNSHPAPNANASADFANFDAFGSSAAAATPAPFPSAPPAGGSSGLANANFANFDHFPKSCSADFGALGTQRGASAGADAGRVDGASSVPADKYAALADLDGIFNTAQSESVFSDVEGPARHKAFHGHMGLYWVRRKTNQPHCTFSFEIMFRNRILTVTMSAYNRCSKRFGQVLPSKSTECTKSASKKKPSTLCLLLLLLFVSAHSQKDKLFLWPSTPLYSRGYVLSGCILFVLASLFTHTHRHRQMHLHGTHTHSIICIVGLVSDQLLLKI